MEFDLKYLSLEPDRHGNLLYVHRSGRRIRLRVTRDDPAFLEPYQKALATLAVLPNAAEALLRQGNWQRHATMVRPGWAATLHGARLAEGRRDDTGRVWRDGSAANGRVRLDNVCASESLHRGS